MLSMFDTIEVGTVPADPQAVAGYVGGNWPTYSELVQRFPHAHHLSIAVFPSEDADALDVEPGDASPAQAPDWTRRQHARGQARPVLYASRDTIPEVLSVLAGAGIARSSVRLWSAHYTYRPHICGPHSCGAGFEADATQWTDKALGRNLDESLCWDAFFAAPTAPPAPAAGLGVLTLEEHRAVNTLLAYRQHPRLHPHGLKVTHELIVRLRKAIWLAAERGVLPSGARTARGWHVNNRSQRYALLWRYSR